MTSLLTSDSRSAAGDVRGAHWLAAGLERLLGVPRHDIPSAAVWLLRQATGWLGLQGAAYWDSPEKNGRMRQLAAVGSLIEANEQTGATLESPIDATCTIGHLTLVPLTDLQPASAARAVVVLDHGDSPEWNEFEQSYLRQFARIFEMAIESAGLQTQAAAALRAVRRDSLTDLPNRVFLEEALAGLAATDPPTPFALLLLDLDHFKDVNDALGHDVGDLLLIAVGKRLRGVLRDGDFAVRLGGDEFVVVMSDVAQRIEVAQLARRLADQIADVRLDLALSINVTTSIGIALAPENGHSMSELLKVADRAMYDAKEAGRNTFRFSQALRRRQAPNRLSIVSHLRDAIDEGLLRLVYQPQIDLRVGRVGGVEALLRVDHPTLGSVSPETLAAVAEDTRLIEQITPWGLNTACVQGLKWRDAGLYRGEVAVNIPASMVQHPRLVQWVSDALAATGLPPAALMLELTERALVRNFELAERTLHELIALGVKVAIDDFGVGYSALSYLHRLPVHQLKLDRTFVEPLPDDADCATLVAGLIRLAAELGITVVAEGVESIEQAQWLAKAGCTIAQGFLFAPPLGPEALETFLAQQSVQANWLQPALQV